MTCPNSAPAQRLLSLDVLRGITIAFMIMVNNPGGPGAWPQMEHAEWNGLTATDLVFPSFLLIVGVSIVFSVESRIRRCASQSQVAWHIVTRAAILFSFGLVGNGFPFFKLEHLRVYGVLQRIAICYLIAGLFYLFDRRAWTKVAVLAAALVSYWILLRWVPVPGAGHPGRDIPFLDKDMNLVAWLDRHLFPGHLYEDWTTHNLRDPEGLLSTIPAVGTTLIGLLAGLWLRTQHSVREKAVGLAAAAAVCLSSGYLWAIWFPLNKKMWTSAYVLAAAGWSLLALTLAFWAVEVMEWGKTPWGRRIMFPWLVFGSNAIVAYMVSELLPGILDNIHFTSGGKQTEPLGWLQVHTFAHIPDPGWRAFAFSTWYALVCFIPVWILYRKKIFLKV